MTTQDWIAAGIALLAFYWLLWRFGITGWVSRLVFKAAPADGPTSGGGCAKCDDD